VVFTRQHKLVGFDLESHLIQPGLLTPPIVCGSSAQWPDRTSKRLVSRNEALYVIRRLLADPFVVIAGANIAFDMAEAINEDPTLLEAVFKAYADGRVHDVLLAQALDAIAAGHLGKAPNGMPLVNAKGKRVRNYDLDLTVRLNLHRFDAKERDFYRRRYALLADVPLDQWPEEAQEYPKDDAWNTVEVAAHQLGLPEHPPEEPHIYGDASLDDPDGCSWVFDRVQDAPAVVEPLTPFRNLSDHAAQAESAFCLHLGAIWGFRTDPLRAALLELRAMELHEIYLRRFADMGLYRLDDKSKKIVQAKVAADRAREGLEVKSSVEEDDEDEESADGTGEDAPEDDAETAEAKEAARFAQAERSLAAQLGYKKSTAAVAKAVAIAYGATEPCERCGGSGKVVPIKQAPCRGLKVRGRFQGCLSNQFCACSGSGVTDKEGDEVICAIKKGGCGGTGFNLDPKKVPALPRAKKGGVSSSRDTLMESGDEALYAFGQNKHAKILGTYLVHIRKGLHKPINPRPNPILETGRASYQDSTQTAPRWTLPAFEGAGLEKAVALAEAAHEPLTVRALRRGWVPSVRECTRARPGRVFGSTDYAALELVTLAQVCLWICNGQSRMAEIINASGDPGLLHTALGAKLLGIPMDEMIVRIKAKDKTAKDFRQAAKPCFHPDTDILTRKGWKKIADLALEDEVACAYPQPGSKNVAIAWEHPLQLTRRKHDKLLHLKNDGIDLRVTPDHNMLAWMNGDWRVVPASEFHLQEGWANAGVAVSMPDVWCGNVRDYLEYAQLMFTIRGRRTRLFADTLELEVDASHMSSSDGLTVTELPYDGDVVCLSVMSSFVVVRDGGIPVITGQCNFGLPGGMKAARLVLSSREEKNGDTVGANGRKYAGIRFCILIDGAPSCGTKQVTKWHRQPIPPTCEHCLRIAEEKLIPAWFSQYPEMEQYFRWVKQEIEFGEGVIPCLGPWLVDPNVPEADRVPHRVRGGCQERDAQNNGFQGLAADGAKYALRMVTREAYLDETSVLYQAKTRIPAFIHDELVTEMDEGLAHLAGPRVAEIMVSAMRVWVPDVTVAADTALMYYISKDAEPVYKDGKLVPWVPKAFQDEKRE
jgi:hypothetical protein